MDYPFRLPDGGTFVVPGWGNLPVELLEALAGVKPVTHCWVEGADFPRLERMCETFGLRHLVFTDSRSGTQSGLSRQTSAGGEKRLEVMIGSDPAQLQEAAEIWHLPGVNPGRLLGYPDCCVASYEQWHQKFPSVDVPGYVDIIQYGRGKTREPARIPFVVNNLFYIYSRRWGVDGAPKREQIMKRNEGLDIDVLNLMSWHPCSYGCAESLRKAEATWAVMRRMVPTLAALVKTCLSRPVLLWDWSRFAVLRGKPDGDGAFSYDAVQPPFSLLEPEKLARIRAGTRVALRPDGTLELTTNGKAEPWRDDPPLLFGFTG